ncbi:hypothetical protein LTR36_004561 [Oleoguttula mirabilis]|uniref:Bacteriophage T5 Orf172 DNA-binding domain-containing protein n=1 Tax=Oleoguttula mirabilis TaxID=1507867 RepID=A0AAV9JGE9_9PEZI|nr:hypothetical protein LTR36_004561 [Oleoguttula mirabilis]
MTPTRKSQQSPSAPSIDIDISLGTPARAPLHVGHNRSASEPNVSAAVGVSPEIVIHSADDPGGDTSPLPILARRLDPTGSSESLPGLSIDAIGCSTQPGLPQSSDGTETTGVRGRSTAIRRRTSSSADGFTAGEASSWALWTVRTEVRALVLEPLPKPNDKGCIYVVEDVATKRHVKIGMTMRPFRTRLAEIARTHKRSLDETNAWHLPGISYIQLLRLEALVHADLAQYQRNLSVRNSSNRRVHREWFEVDKATAQKTVRMWWDIMCNIGIKPGMELEPVVCEALNSSPAFDVDMADEANGDQADTDSHAEHTERIRMWTDLLLLRQRHAAWWGSSSGAKWIMGCALLWMLPELMGLPPNVGYILQAAGVALWTRHTFSSF